MDFLSWQQWLDARNIDIVTMTPELEAALQSQYESDCQRLAPVTEKLVATSDCPPRVHRLVQPTLFDARTHSYTE